MTIQPADSLTLALRKLNSCGLQYMLTGSAAGLFYGRRRTTDDVDAIVDCAGIDSAALSAHFAPEYFLDADQIENSLPYSQMFNAIPLSGGIKIDLIPLRKEPFERAKFSRRRQLSWSGTLAVVIEATDLVISKLQWVKDSHSERQLADIRVIMSREASIDEEYLRRWVTALGLSEVLEASRTTRYDA